MVDLHDGFRCAMRGLASSVCVVTAQTADGPRGMTAAAVMSLSVEAPAIAVGINRNACLNPLLTVGAARDARPLPYAHGRFTGPAVPQRRAVA
jgi:flavin reductase (DIM6/NTAB) family NADH-FMN oxidoreductase RutF